MISAAYRAQADALEIEALAKRRLADEYDAAQDRGEVKSNGGARNFTVPNRNSEPSAKDIGISRKDIHEARIIRDAEKSDPGISGAGHHFLRPRKAIDVCLLHDYWCVIDAWSHRMAPTLPQVLRLAGCTRDQFNNWRRRDFLLEDIPETEQGVPRPMVKKAAYELALMAALVDVGFDPAEAANRARVYFGLKPPTRPEWLIHDPSTGADIHAQKAAANRMTIASLASTDLPSAENANAPSSTRFVAVHVGEIVRRVDTLFAEAS